MASGPSSCGEVLLERIDERQALVRGQLRALTPASIKSHGWKTKMFLAWYWPQGRPFADVTIQDVDDFLAVKGKATWARRSVAIAAQALKAFFRYAERARKCRAGIAAAITGPRIFDFETLPSGPAWADVEAMIGSLDVETSTVIERDEGAWTIASQGADTMVTYELTRGRCSACLPSCFASSSTGMPTR